METRFIVVVGGVMSGVGKGVTTASLGKILKEHGYKVTLIKIDPYINFDAGTLRPTEHGEVWVTEDGGEIDQDLGTYERFINEDIPKKNNLTTGQIYKSVIDRERRGEYLGQTVQFVPHIIDEIIGRVKQAAQDYEIAIIEVGGTVGDYENIPFLFALKALEREIGSDHVSYVLVTYLPIPQHTGEMKTKPTQQAIRLLGKEGITPDFIICRSQVALDQVRRKKIENFVHIKSDHVISAPDIKSIYQIPLDLEQEHIGEKILKHFKLPSKKTPEWSAWAISVTNILKPDNKLTVAIIGKYLDLGDYSITDSYVSIYHALIHAGAKTNSEVAITWIDAKQFEQDPSSLQTLKNFDGIIVPGGFGASGVEGKISAITYAREHNIPFLGLCYGLQLAVVEFARNLCGLPNAHTTEVNQATEHPVIDIVPLQKEILERSDYGGTMRLGAYSAVLKKDTLVRSLYEQMKVRETGTSDSYVVLERHRHRYEVNNKYVDLLEQKGLVFSGYHKRIDGTQLMEFIELPEHRFFVATQAHPEFKSRLGYPNPMFAAFVKVCREYALEKEDADDVSIVKTVKQVEQSIH